MVAPGCCKASQQPSNLATKCAGFGTLLRAPGGMQGRAADKLWAKRSAEQDFDLPVNLKALLSWAGCWRSSTRCCQVARQELSSNRRTFGKSLRSKSLMKAALSSTFRSPFACTKVLLTTAKSAGFHLSSVAPVCTSWRAAASAASGRADEPPLLPAVQLGTQPILDNEMAL